MKDKTKKYITAILLMIGVIIAVFGLCVLPISLIWALLCVETAFYILTIALWLFFSSHW